MQSLGYEMTNAFQERCQLVPDVNIFIESVHLSRDEVNFLTVSSTVIEFIHIICQKLCVPYPHLDTNNEKDE